MFCNERVRSGNIEFRVRSQVWLELIQRRTCADTVGTGRLSIQSEMSTTGWLAQAFRLLDDAE